jgi:hypothetical protein
MSTREQLQARLDSLYRLPRHAWPNTTGYPQKWGMELRQALDAEIDALEAQLAALPPDSAEVAPDGDRFADLLNELPWQVAEQLAQQNQAVRELIAKWDREADAYGLYETKAAKRSCARELEAALQVAGAQGGKS